jgi:hypothetical protein
MSQWRLLQRDLLRLSTGSIPCSLTLALSTSSDPPSPHPAPSPWASSCLTASSSAPQAPSLFISAISITCCRASSHPSASPPTHTTRLRGLSTPFLAHPASLSSALTVPGYSFNRYVVTFSRASCKNNWVLQSHMWLLFST